LNWPIQKERIVAFAQRHRGRVILDATGVGDPIFDDLKRVLPDIEGFKLTAGSKTDLIQRLSVAMEQRRVSWPCTRASGTVQGTPASDWDILTNELKRFEYVIGPSGQVSYGAPSGFHDDCVIALALANHRRWETENCGRMLTIGGGERRRYAMARRRERCLLG